MAESRNLVLGLPGLISQASDASMSLYQFIDGLKLQTKQVRDLTSDLAALTDALVSLKQYVDTSSEHIPNLLALPLHHCHASCKNFQDQLQQYPVRSDTSKTSCCDETIIRHMREELDGFKQLTSCYESTFRVVLADITLRTSKTTTGSLVIYKELLSHAQVHLQDRLAADDVKLGVFSLGSSPDKTEFVPIKDERSSIERCLEVCADFSEHISESQRKSGPNVINTTERTAEMACILLVDGTRIDSAKLIGTGIDGFIIRMGPNVLKAPKLLGYIAPNGDIRPDDDNELHIEDLDAEKQVYARLGKAPGIAECIDITPNGILLEYCPKGSLDMYMARNEAPDFAVRLCWILQAANAIKHCHDHNVLVFDIALRNLLVADEFTVKMIDFANSSLLPEDMDTSISTADNDGCTVALDLLHFSNVIYSIITWQNFHVECATDSEWPEAVTMPDMQGLAFQNVMQKCWVREYATAGDLIQDLHQIAKSFPDTPTNATTFPSDQYASPAAQP